MKTQRHVVVISPWSFIYMLLAALAVWVAIQISGIILSLVVAAIFAIALNPMVTWLEKVLKIRRGFAVGLIVFTFFFIIGAVLWLVIPSTVKQAQTLATNLPTYQVRIQESVAHQPQLNWLYQRVIESFARNSEKIGSSAAAFSLSLASSVFNLLTFFIFLIYMLASGRRFAVILSGLLPKKAWREQFVQVMHDVSNKLGHWLRGQLVLCLIIFSASFIGLSAIGVDYALTLALFAGLMEAVPMVGAYLGAIPAVMVALLSGSPVKAAGVGILFLVMQQLEGNIVVPQVMKKAVGVHPMIVLLSAMIGGTLLGFVGILIAVPVTAAASVILGSVRSHYDSRIEK